MPALVAGEVHVWRARVGAIPASLELLLDAGERARADTIAVRPRARRFARTRGLLRRQLALYTGADAAELEIVADANGKPRVRLAGGPAFNVSHSRELVLLAFTASAAVGVDVEVVRPVRDPLALARRALGATAAQELRALAPAARERAFLRAWVLHEAQLKRSGAGLAGGRHSTTAGWRAELPLGPRAVGALSLARAPLRLALYDWRAPERA